MAFTFFQNIFLTTDFSWFHFFSPYKNLPNDSLIERKIARFNFSDSYGYIRPVLKLKKKALGTSIKQRELLLTRHE